MLHHAAIYVSDLDRSAAFYGELLGLREHRRVTLDALGIEQAFLTAGTKYADLVVARRLDGTTPNADKSELFHLAYELPADRPLGPFADALKAAGTEVLGPMEHEVHLDGSGIRDSLYLRDPDGHVIEVTQERAEL